MPPDFSPGLPEGSVHFIDARLSPPLHALQTFPISTESENRPPIGNTDGLFSQALDPVRSKQCLITSVKAETLEGNPWLSFRTYHQPLSPLY